MIFSSRTDEFYVNKLCINWSNTVTIKQPTILAILQSNCIFKLNVYWLNPITPTLWLQHFLIDNIHLHIIKNMRVYIPLSVLRDLQYVPNSFQELTISHWQLQFYNGNFCMSKARFKGRHLELKIAIVSFIKYLPCILFSKRQWKKSAIFENIFFWSINLLGLYCSK